MGVSLMCDEPADPVNNRTNHLISQRLHMVTRMAVHLCKQLRSLLTCRDSSSVEPQNFFQGGRNYFLHIV